MLHTFNGPICSSLARHHKSRLPQPSSIIASSFTSPIDSIYLAAIFDPIFTASYPSTRLVHRISLLQAILRSFQSPQIDPPADADLTDLQTLLQRHPNQPVVVFPECTTTNGRGILQFGASLLTAPSKTKIFPISLRYFPADITTPIPYTYLTFLWKLLSRPTHCIRVRIAESVHITSQLSTIKSSYKAHLRDSNPDNPASSSDTLLWEDEGEVITLEERKVLDKIAEALATGRVKRVGLSIKDKAGFVKTWMRQRRRWSERYHKILGLDAPYIRTFTGCLRRSWMLLQQGVAADMLWTSRENDQYLTFDIHAPVLRASLSTLRCYIEVTDHMFWSRLYLQWPCAVPYVRSGLSVSN